MSLYYTAAALADMPNERLKAFAAAHRAAVLDPTYKSRDKAGPHFRTAFGRTTFRRLKALAGPI
jgi:hypothetical protein